MAGCEPVAAAALANVTLVIHCRQKAEICRERKPVLMGGLGASKPKGNASEVHSYDNQQHILKVRPWL